MDCKNLEFYPYPDMNTLNKSLRNNTETGFTIACNSKFSESFVKIKFKGA